MLSPNHNFQKSYRDSFGICSINHGTDGSISLYNESKTLVISQQGLSLSFGVLLIDPLDELIDGHGPRPILIIVVCGLCLFEEIKELLPDIARYGL